MNDRQKALLAYLYTIKPHLHGSQTPEDMLRRIVTCVGEDVGFAATGFITAATKHGERLLNESVAQMTTAAAGALSKGVENFLRGLTRRKR